MQLNRDRNIRVVSFCPKPRLGFLALAKPRPPIARAATRVFVQIPEIIRVDMTAHHAAELCPAAGGEVPSDAACPTTLPL